MKLIWKISHLVLGETLGVFVDILTTDGKYPVLYCENLPLPVQMQLSEKRKTFSEFFVAFMESTSNFKPFQKKIMVIANIFPKLETVKYFVRPLCKKRRFRTRFDSQ